jgi:hypothetical protein
MFWTLVQSLRKALTMRDNRVISFLDRTLGNWRVMLEFGTGKYAEALAEHFDETHVLKEPVDDDFIAEQGIERVDFIKADSLETLKGLRKTIDRHRTTLVFSYDGRGRNDLIQRLPGYRFAELQFNMLGKGKPKPITQPEPRYYETMLGIA